MRVFYSFQDAQLDEESVVTIGAFDGIHLGHRALIDGVCRAAREQDRASVVVSFFPHPSVVLGRADPFYLTSSEEKIALLNATGVDVLVIMEFKPETTKTRARDFLSLLIDHLHMRELHVGHDFAFGYKREGNIEYLTRVSVERRFTLCVLAPQLEDDVVVSSSEIRQYLRNGDVETAAKRLGRYFRLSGTLVKGDSENQVNSLPTAILDVWPEHAIPANGMYACWAWVDNLQFRATVHIGTRSMQDGRPVRIIEVHLLDFEQELYGINIALDFVARLHDKPPSSDPDHLSAQIKNAVDKVRGLLQNP